MDNKDELILSYLRMNSRETLTNISKKTQIPVSTIFERMRNENQIIRKHTTLVDFGKMGYPTVVNILIKSDKDHKEELKNYLYSNRNVNSFYKVTNGYDFLFECVFRSIFELENFIEHLENKFNIKSKQVLYTVEDIKREGFLSGPELFGLIVK
jgi:DNA-binding Lrp family transcriptional regulator